MGGSKKPEQTGPAINAKSKEEESFVKCVRPASCISRSRIRCLGSRPKLRRLIREHRDFIKKAEGDKK
jgi:hypothetical protein